MTIICAVGYSIASAGAPPPGGERPSGSETAAGNSSEILRVRTGLAPFEYMEAPDALPNYVPGAKWGTLAEPIHRMQKPLSPEESMKHLATFPGFKVSLFAAEPDIAKPICMAWDERGRLWVAETVDYPNNLQAPGQGHDRIKICEDTDGDGRADKFTVFADKLSIPTGFVFARGGVILVHSGKTEFLKDTDGDDKADVRETLFTGWGTRDTHAGPSNLRNGFDNWIWGTVGYSGFEGTVGGKHLRFGQGIYRFKPDGSALEFLRSTDNNTWGLGFSEDNIVFGSTANNDASVYLPIPNRYYEAVNGWSASRLETIADSPQIFPITTKVRQVDWHGKYTAGAGSALYTARHFPREYWNRVQFVAEPTGHLLGQFHLEPRVADFIARNAKSFLASDDEWTSPVCAEVGPEGALWVIDWYSYVVQHNPTPQGFRTGKGNAYETTLRDKTHGRIYRVTWGDAPARKTSSLAHAKSAQLVNALKADNMLWRSTAQRLLVERGNKDVVAELCQLLHDQSVDAIGLNAGAVHALWTLQGLGAIHDSDGKVIGAVESALGHPSAPVRKAAVQVLPRSTASMEQLLRRKLLDDVDAQVRLATLLTLSEMPPSEPAGRAVFAMLQRPDNSHDKWILDGATCAAARHDLSFLGAAAGAAIVPTEGVAQVIQRVAKHYATDGPVESVLATLSALKTARPAVALQVLAGLVSGWPEGKAPAIDLDGQQSLQQLFRSLPEEARSVVLTLSQKWHKEKMFGDASAEIAGLLRRKLADGTKPTEERVGAVKELLGLQDNPTTIQFILEQINLLTLPETATGFIRELAQSRNVGTGALLLAHWQDFTPSVRRAAIGTLMRRVEWSGALLDAIEKGGIHSTDLAPEQWSQLKLNPNQALAQRAEKLSKGAGMITADRAGIVQRLLPLAKQPGDPARGKEVFATNCAVCHTFNRVGGKVGPDLTGIGARDRSEILIDILDPNRSVEANYRMWTVSTRDGESYSGRLETETQTTVELLDPTGMKHVLQRKDIESMRGSELSIMPNGFESLPPEDLKALLAYLTQTQN